jgi:hypothetical protein
MKKKDHMELLCDAGEMFALLSGVSGTKKIGSCCVSGSYLPCFTITY